MTNARYIGTVAASSVIGKMPDGRLVAVHPNHAPRVIDPIAGAVPLDLTSPADIAIDPTVGEARWNSNIEDVGTINENPK